MGKYKLLLNGKEIAQPDNASILFENSTQKENPESISFPGRIMKTTDKHTLKFHFKNGVIAYLHFKKPLRDEAVKEFVEKRKFFEYNYHGSKK